MTKTSNHTQGDTNAKKTVNKPALSKVSSIGKCHSKQQTQAS